MSTDPGRTPTRRTILKAGEPSSRQALSARVGGPPRRTGRGQANNQRRATAARRSCSRASPCPSRGVVLPTDALPPPEGPKLRIAAITTAYFKYSHADDIITKFIEGYAILGRTHQPHCDGGQPGDRAVPRDRHRPRPGGAVRDSAVQHARRRPDAGRHDALAVDGVLLVGEHGDYPFNAKGQHLYPRRRLFEEIVKVFRRSGRSVPVYNDKHFSYAWPTPRGCTAVARAGLPDDGRLERARRLCRPPLALRPGIVLEGALALGFGGLEVYGFHTLELLQAFVERRRGGEVGIRAVQCLEGAAAWEAARQGRWRVDLLRTALGQCPRGFGRGTFRATCDRADPEAVVFLIEYSDGFAAAAYLLRGLAAEFGFAARSAAAPSRSGPGAS